jgi:hypothetical protein
MYRMEFEERRVDYFEMAKNFLLAEENRTWIFAIVGGIVVLIVLFFLWRMFRRGRKGKSALPPELRIDLAQLIQEGPPSEPPILEFYNLPVRLAGIVVAPVGRLRELPSPAELPPIFESVLPGLDRVADRHQPLIRRWPHQVSTRGFAVAFFNNIRLPGEAGKGTPWSAVAGIFKHHGTPMMIGLILRAASPNSLGQIVVNTEHEWLGCLRVKTLRD